MHNKSSKVISNGEWTGEELREAERAIEDALRALSRAFDCDRISFQSGRMVALHFAVEEPAPLVVSTACDCGDDCNKRSVEA